MNILVTGANGQLGCELREVSKGLADRYIFSDVSSLPGQDTVFLDITNRDAVALVCESEDIGAIVNCAAYTNVDKAEEDQGMADMLNRQGPASLADVCAERGMMLVHISTDYVFRGNRTVPYTEEVQPEPLGVYGGTKFAGETAIMQSGCRYMIIRTAWMFSPFGKNFVKTMLKLTSERPELNVVFDQTGTPTYALDLARLITGVFEERKYGIFATGVGTDGIYNFTDEGVISWFDFAVAIRDIASSLENGSGRARRLCTIRPCHTDEYPAKAGRPHYSVLDKTKIRQTLGIEIPYWRDSLEDCIKRILS